MINNTEGTILVSAALTLIICTILGIWKSLRRDWTFYLNTAELYLSWIFIGLLPVFFVCGLFSGNKIFIYLAWADIVIALLRHVILAIVGNYRKWWSIPVIAIARIGFGFLCPVYLLAGILGGRRRKEGEDPASAAIASAIHSAAFATAIYWFAILCHRLVREEAYIEDYYQRCRTASAQADPFAVPDEIAPARFQEIEVKQKPKKTAFRYKWVCNGQTFTGIYECENEPALRQHVKDVGGELIEVLGVN